MAEETKTYIEPFDEEAKLALKRLSAYALPDEPARHGMKAAAVKPAFWKPFTEGDCSVVGLLNRLIAALNELFAGHDADLADHEERISTNKSTLDGHGTRLGTAEQSIKANTNGITSLQDAIKSLGKDGETVYADGKLGLAPTLLALLTAATQSKDGVMSATDKKNLDTLMALLGEEEGDDNKVVDKIREVLAAFSSFENDNANVLVDALARKLPLQDGTTNPPMMSGVPWDKGAYMVYGVNGETNRQEMIRTLVTPSDGWSYDQTLVRRDNYGRIIFNDPVNDRDGVNLRTLKRYIAEHMDAFLERLLPPAEEVLYG